LAMIGAHCGQLLLLWLSPPMPKGLISAGATGLAEKTTIRAIVESILVTPSVGAA
jgi:hypothetical protein